MMGHDSCKRTPIDHLSHLSIVIGLVFCVFVSIASAKSPEEEVSLHALTMHRSPVDLILSDDETWLLSVNQSANSLSLLDLQKGSVVHEFPIGERPTAIAQVPGKSRFLVTSSYSGELHILDVEFPRIRLVSKAKVNGQPHGVAIDRTGRLAYIALTDLDQVLVWDLLRSETVAKIDVGRWPRYLALSRDDSTLAVGTSGDRGVSIVDLKERKLRRIDRFVGLNIGHLQLAPNSDEVLFPWMVYRRNPITKNNIQLGWVLASRLGRIRMDGDSKREAMSLDPPGMALADPHGIAISSDGLQLVISSSGTHELIVLKNDQLPFQDRGSTDHIDPALLADSQRFRRIEVGGRPMGVRMSKSNHRVFVANYLSDSIQIVELASGKVADEISLGPTPPPTPQRQGEEIFFDAKRSLDQWYSCASCHYEGGTNAVSMDTMNDGTAFTFKSIPHLYQLDKTGPWTWHGWQSDLHESVAHSLRTTMLGPEPTDEDVQALVAYFASTKPPPSLASIPADKTVQDSIERGQAIFHGEAGACSNCHSGPMFTDGQIHDLGIGGDADRYRGINTPSLIGVFRKTALGSEGRSSSLEQFLTGPHAPEKVEGRNLSLEETTDLIRYVKSL